MRHTFPREFYVPKGAVKVADKHSDAVAYLTTSHTGKPAATIFVGKRAKPYSCFSYLTEAARERAVRLAFEGRRAALQRKAEADAARKEWKHSYKPGDLFCASWGYEQTNIDWYECIEVRGSMLIVREIAQARTYDMGDRGQCVPQPGTYIGDPIRVRAQQRGIRVGRQWAGFEAPTMVAGVPTYRATYWSSYA